MMRLIDAENLWVRLHEAGGCDATDEWSKGYDAGIDVAIGILETEPTVDAEPVRREGKRGQWEEVVHPADGLFGLYQPYTRCSECGREVIGTIKFADKYCGNCGAEMRNGGCNETL